MTTEEQNLSSEQKELVAVGASIGAGCQPCVSNHLKAGAEAGLDGEQLLAAVTSAERVRAEAAVAMGDHARAQLGASVTSPALPSRLEEALASLGAALGANDATNIDRQLHAAAELGASHSQIARAIDTAYNVQEHAARIHRREAERLLAALAPTTATAETDVESGCGCATNDETEEASVTADEPVAVTSGHPAGCGEMPAQFAAANSSAARAAGCRDMFARFISAAASAETDRAPTATPGAGSCNKEA
jgi:AhpD family alkylhydroperoxidase